MEYQTSEKPVSAAIVASVLSKQIDDLGPTLTQFGYAPKLLAELLGTRPGEIREQQPRRLLDRV